MAAEMIKNTFFMMLQLLLSSRSAREIAVGLPQLQHIFVNLRPI
jgi:hypothetical protein